MSKFRKGLMKRVMAVILSGAMIMSNMTVYAAEAGYDAANGYVETASEDEKSDTAETDVKETKTSEEAAADTQAESALETAIEAETAEKETTETTAESESTQETTTEETESTDSETETKKSDESETAADSETAETETVEEETTEEETTEAETETESTEEETTEEAEDNKELAEGSLDISGGLTAGTEYGDDVVKITVLENMTYKKATDEIDGVKYTGYVTGANNPKNDAGSNMDAAKSVLIPTTGAAFKINPGKAAKLTIYVRGDGSKSWYFVKDDGAGGVLLTTGLTQPSACTFSVDAGATYYFYAAGSKINVCAVSWKEKNLNRPAWADVAKPVISDVSLDSTDASKINVTVDAIVGDEGADKVEVFMYDEEGAEAATAESTKELAKTVLTLSPKASGKYTIKAVTSREDESDIKESDVKEIEFELPLAVPVMKSATNLGGGSVEISWGAVAGAEKYVLEVADHAEIEPMETETAGKIVKGLTVGQTYKFTVYAVRGEEKTAKSEPIECTVTEEEQREWKFVVYGNGAKEAKASYKEIEKGKEVYIDAETGKIVPASNDGLAFYYTEINPNTTNFTFSANAHVDSWTYSNGQEGFGIMAADTVGRPGDKDTRLWNNSYQAVVSKINYKWNGIEVTEDGSGETIGMQLGVGSTEKVGITPDDIEALNNGTITAPAKLSATQTAIDTTFAKYGAGQYNMVKNWKNDSAPVGSEHELYEDFYLQIQKNNTGYFVSYTKYVMDENGNCKLDENGNKILDESTTITKKYYDTEALNSINSSSVYVGVFASRHAQITFSDMNLKTVACEDDAEREERPAKYVNVTKSVLSGSVTNSPEYDFMFASNWNGTVVVKDSSGNILSRHTKKDADGNEIEVDYYDVRGSLDPDIAALQDGDNAKDTKVHISLEGLSVGKNVYTIEFTPDKNWAPEYDKYTGNPAVKLKSYDMVRFTHTVEYKKYGQEGQTIYVSPDGSSANIGTKESPLDIYTAVNYVQPGQTIMLAGGRYSLSRTLQIPRGINGKPDIVDGKETYKKYIKMMTDPSSGERAVLDFNSLVAAVVTVGDYWYFKDFDVIRCKDGEKGVQVSGSWCVFDQVNTYRNGSTGLQICRAANTDVYADWPHDNLILNCNSYLNVDKGYEDADGFAAKLTSGSNNVFDGCIAAFNADDGWDLFAKAQTGSIGAVVIKNSIAYRNGYVLKAPDGSIKTPEEAAAEGVEVQCVLGDGNGNGFKMGGDGLAAGSIYDPDYDPSAVIPNSGHKLINSLSFGNKSKGFDSNSAPNVKVYNSISFNNDGANISFSTYDTNKNTDYELQNVISLRTDVAGNADGVSQRGKQDANKVKNDTVYYWDSSAKAAKNASGKTITADDFVSLDYPYLNTVSPENWRNADGTIKTDGFLQLKEGAGSYPSENTPSMGGTPSVDVEIGDDTDGSISAGNSGTTDDTTDDYGEDFPAGGLNVKDENGNPKYFGKIWAAEIKYVDYTDKEPIAYTGKKIQPEVHVRFSGNAALLRLNKDYKLKYANNVNAGTATVTITGIGNYAGYDNTQTFEILPISITDNSVSIPSGVAVESGAPESALKPTWLGKALKKDTDYTVTTDKEDSSKLVVTGIGNFTGEKSVNAYTVSADKLISKASVRITDKNIVYTGDEVKPACEVKLGGSVITDGFTVEYANNIEIGKATLTVVGDGEKYFGSKSVTFSIKGGNLMNAEIAYRSGSETIALTERISQLNGSTFNGSSMAIPENLIIVKMNGKTLKNNADYTVVQKNTEKAGTASVTIRGINGFTGAQSFKFNVKPLDISTLSDDAFVFARTCEYMTGGVKYVAGDNFNIKINGMNISSKQYRLNYKNNTKVGPATVTVTGMNGLTGKKTLDFTVEKASLDDVDISLIVKDISTNGKGSLKYSDLKAATITLKQSVNGKNKTLSPMRDYNRAGTEYYIDTNGNYEIDEADTKLDVSLKETMKEFDVNKGYLTILIRVPAAANGNFKEGTYVEGYFRVGTFNIRGIKVINKADRVFGKEYNATSGITSALTFDTVLANMNDYITVTYTDPKTKKTETLTWGTKNDYETHPELLEPDGFVIVPGSYKANSKVGVASVQIKGTGKYAGTKRISFKIITKKKADQMAAK